MSISILSNQNRNSLDVNIPVDRYISQEHLWQRRVRASNKRFKIVVWHRRARKTTMALNMLIEACCSTRNCTYGYIAPTFTQAKSIAVVDPMMLKYYLPAEVCKKPFNESDLRQEFITNSVLEIKGADKVDSLRGVGWNGVVLEEWATMRHGRQIWEEILEPILRENKGFAIFIFTPKGRNFASQYYERAKTDKSGDWGAFLLKASQSNLIAQEELDKAKESMPQRLYNQEFECDFLEDASSVFHDVERCVSGVLTPPTVGRKYVMGVDLGRTNDFTVLTVMDIGSNNVVAFQRFTQTGWDFQKEKIVLLAKQYNNARIVIDATGFSAGSVVAEDLKKMPIVEDLKIVSLSVVPFNFTHNSKKALVEKLIVSIEQGLISFPNIPELVDELRAFTYEVTQTGNVKYTSPEGLHDDCVMSLGLAVYGLGSFIYAPLNKPRTIRHTKPKSRANI